MAETESSFIIAGDAISAEELMALLAEKFPEKKLTVSARGKGEEAAMVADLESQLDAKCKECEDLEAAAGKAMLSIDVIQQQQQSLFDDFVLLRSKYDEQKSTLLESLWTHCASYHKDLEHIPAAEDPEIFVETEDKVGAYNLDDMLGEGQFATVMSCWKDNDSGDINKDKHAIKIIKKEIITTFASLKRLSNEVFHLQTLKSPYVVKISDCIHTSSKLYIVTERGGADLFDFFDNHPEGVDPKWAKEIIANIMKGVTYIHRRKICHRDLKPENILLSFDTETGKCVDLKLCDFGLSTVYDDKVLLKDFCGSPGFFAPEMIMHGAYHGDKADLWSVGCIMLELVMGHEQFCDMWMTSYNFDVLQDKSKFTEEIGLAVKALPDHLAANLPADLNNFLVPILKMRSSERPNTEQLAQHDWLEGKVLDGPLSDDKEDDLETGFGTMNMDELSSPSKSISIRIDAPDYEGRGHSAAPSPSMSSSSLRDSRGQSPGVVDPLVLRNASQAMEGRARHHLEAHNHPGGNATNGASHSSKNNTAHHEIHLPPIDPPTPSVGKARKFLNRDDAKNANKKLGLAFAMGTSPEKSGGDKISPIARLGSPPNNTRVDSDTHTDTSRSSTSDMNANGKHLEESGSVNDSPRSYARSEHSSGGTPVLGLLASTDSGYSPRSPRGPADSSVSGGNGQMRQSKSENLLR